MLNLHGRDPGDLRVGTRPEAGLSVEPWAAHDPSPESHAPMSAGAPSPLDVIAREIAVGGLAGLVAGGLVAGIGGRIFMRIVALIDPSAVGLLTSNGNRIGDVTLVGTLAFVIFVGPIFGAAAGALWVSISTWLPGKGAARSMVAGAVAAAITPFFVVKAAESDFQLVGPPLSIIALVIGLSAGAGIAVARFDDWLQWRLSASPSSAGRFFYRLVTLVGLLFLPLAISAYFSTEIPGYRPPGEVGVALLTVAGATVTWWILRAWRGVDRPPLALILVARGALAAAVILGAVKIGAEMSGILSLFGIGR